MDINSQFTFAMRDTKYLMDEYSLLFRRQREFSSEALSYFKSVRSELMDNRLKLIELSPNTQDEDLVSQLVGRHENGDWRDKVHSFGTENLDQIYRYRIGGAEANKTAYALVWERKVIAAIYVNRRQGLGDNVDETLKSDLSKANGFDCTVAYSISSFGVMAREGQMLIFALRRHLNQELPSNIKITTLSPFRTFSRFLGQQGGDVLPLIEDNEKRRLAVQYLRTNKDGVTRFHRGNGAIAIDLHDNANVKGTDDYEGGRGIMINYFYPRCDIQLQHNMALYKAERFDDLMSPRLREIAGLSRELPAIESHI